MLPGVMGMEGFAEAAHALLPGWHGRRARGRRAAGAVQVLPRRAAHARAAGARARRRRRRRSWPTASSSAAARCPAQGEQRDAALHRPRAARPRGARGAAGGRAARRRRRRASGHDAVYRVYFHGPAYQVLDRAWRDNGHVVGRWPASCPPTTSRRATPTEFVPRLIELCFQTAGRVGARHGGADGAADARRPRRALRRRRRARAGCGRSSTPRDGGGIDAEVVDEHGRVRVRLEGYRTIELPGGLDDDALGADPRGDGRRERRCSAPSPAWRSSTAASPRCG